MPTTEATSSMSCRRASESNTDQGSWLKPKTSYQLAHPAIHARHRWLKLRPRTLLQLHQTSQTARPLPVLDVLSSTVLSPSLSRSIPRILRGGNGLGPYGLVIARSELYESLTSNGLDANKAPGNVGGDQREIIATISEPTQKEAQLKGKANVFLTFGSFCEASPLPGGSYEFLVHNKDGVQIMRWALRRSKRRRISIPSSHLREETKRFTFSVIDPSSRRHPVIASMTGDHLEVYQEYSRDHRFCTRPASPNFGLTEFSDRSEIESLDHNPVIVDDRLRVLILVTGIWVAFREGWSHHFAYHDPAAISHAKMVAPPGHSRFRSSTTNISGEHTVDSDGDEVSRNPKRWTSVALRVREFHMTSPSTWFRSCNDLVRRSSSTRTI